MHQMSKADQTHAQFWSRGSTNSAVSAVAKKSKEQVVQLYGNVLADTSRVAYRIGLWQVTVTFYRLCESLTPLRTAFNQRSNKLSQSM